MNGISGINPGFSSGLGTAAVGSDASARQRFGNRHATDTYAATPKRAGFFKKLGVLGRGLIHGLTTNVVKAVADFVTNPWNLLWAGGLIALSFTPLAPILLPAAAAFGILSNGGAILKNAATIRRGWQRGDLNAIEGGAAGLSTNSALLGLSMFAARTNLRVSGETTRPLGAGFFKSIRLAWQNARQFKQEYAALGWKAGWRKFQTQTGVNVQNFGRGIYQGEYRNLLDKVPEKLRQTPNYQRMRELVEKHEAAGWTVRARMEYFRHARPLFSKAHPIGQQIDDMLGLTELIQPVGGNYVQPQVQPQRGATLDIIEKSV